MLEAGHSDHAQIRQQGEASTTPWNRHNRTSESHATVRRLCAPGTCLIGGIIVLTIYGK